MKPPVIWRAAVSIIHQDACICYKTKLKKLNCNFIVPFDRFAANFAAPELFVTVALSSHCCRAMHLCAPLIVHMCLCLGDCEPQLRFLFALLSRVSSKSFFLGILNIHWCHERAIGETNALIRSPHWEPLEMKSKYAFTYTYLHTMHMH